MDRHWAPAMTRESICFGVYVDGLCAVGCDSPRVLAAMEAVKATLDAAGLQCSELEADTSRQVFTALQLDHESGILSLKASRIWRLRHGLKFAARQKQLTGDQVAKLIGHIIWSCLLRRPALSLINAGYRFARTFGPRSGRLWPVVVQGLHLQPCQSLVIVGPCYKLPLVVHVGAMELRVAAVIQWMLLAAGSCAERWKVSAGMDSNCTGRKISQMSKQRWIWPSTRTWCWPW